VCGVDPEHGATIIEAEEAAVFRAMSRRAQLVVIVTDSSKVGMSSLAIICPAGDIDILITDNGVCAGVRVLIACTDVKVDLDHAASSRFTSFR
jgi:DeoR/GlpR family transcriptional regulator of sugar metabolism